MKQNNQKIIEEQILTLLEQGADPDKIKESLPDNAETRILLSLIKQLKDKTGTIPDSRRAFNAAYEKLVVTPSSENRYINSTPRESRDSWINQLTYVVMKTKAIIGASVAGLIIAAGISGYLLVTRTANNNYNGTPPGNTEIASAPQADINLKSSDVSLESPETLVAAISAMADAELPGEEIYEDIDLVSLDNNIINDIYNAYDETQL